MKYKNTVAKEGAKVVNAKGRITCISWVDNLLVFSSVGLGQSTVVSFSLKEDTTPSYRVGKHSSTSTHTSTVKMV